MALSEDLADAFGLESDGEEPVGIRELLSAISPLYSLIAILVLWELIARAGLVRYYFLPPLTDVVATFVQMVLSLEIVDATLLTLKRAFFGLLISSTLGVTIGILAARNRVADWFFNPLFTIGYQIPKITLIPAFMLWFGIGDTSKIILVATSTVFPIVVNTYEGAREVEETLVWSAKMMGTSERRLLRRVVLPAAMPAILTGIQIATPIALIVTVVFEMVAGGGGLGFLEIQGVRKFRATQTYAVLIAIAIVGIVLDRGIRRVRTRLLAWE